MAAIALQTPEIRELVKMPFLYPAMFLSCGSGRAIVEVGPGRGDFLFHLAASNPDANVIGIEIKGKRVDKLIHRIEKRRLSNVHLIQDDARRALPRFFNEGSIDEIHILFPDPWPKKRHTKNRAINADFLADCCKHLKKGGHLYFATDFFAYAESVSRDVAGIPSFKSCYEKRISENSTDAYPTFFAQKWIAQGRKNTYQKYRKVE